MVVDTGGARVRVKTGGNGQDSTLHLLNRLICHHSQTAGLGNYVGDKASQDHTKKKLKSTVFSLLLSHRKEAGREQWALDEVEAVMWHGFLLRQRRRYDQAATLDTCLHQLQHSGQLCEGSEVRTVLRLLVALSKPPNHTTTTLAQLRPRTIHHHKTGAPSPLPQGPLQYGDTFQYSGEHGRHYTHFPSHFYQLEEGPLEDGVWGGSLLRLCNLAAAPPGTGLTPLLQADPPPQTSTRILGALVRGQGQEGPHTVLSLPELPPNPHGYLQLSLCHPTTTTSPQPPTSTTAAASLSPVGSDEGYASFRVTRPQTPEEEEDMWRDILEGPPLTARRTWESLGHIPLTPDKPFLTEAGHHTSHYVWLLHRELWGSLGSATIPTLCVVSPRELCRDVLNLLIGVPSQSFLWAQEDDSFCVRAGLCCTGVTPAHLQASLLPLLQCGTNVARLERDFVPSYEGPQLLQAGAVWRAFTVAVTAVLRMYREAVLRLSEETCLGQLHHKAQPLLTKIKFLSHLCDSVRQKEGPRGGGTMLRGLALLDRLLSHMVSTKDRDSLLLLTYVFKSSCAPFLRYLEAWIYQGSCQDPYQEFMVKVDGAALLRHDRTYWTHGYTQRPPAPSLLQDTLHHTFLCGKSLNLLKLCAPKHHLVRVGAWQHPTLQMCTSTTELDQMFTCCQAYGAHMDLLATHTQVSVQQKAQAEVQEQQRLARLSTTARAASLSLIEDQLVAARQQVAEHKRLQLEELKAQVVRAAQERQAQQDQEAAQEAQLSTQYQIQQCKRQQHQQLLREQVEEVYRERLRAAEKQETLARWRVDRCRLNEARRHLLTAEWLPQPADTTAASVEVKEQSCSTGSSDTTSSPAEDPGSTTSAAPTRPTTTTLQIRDPQHCRHEDMKESPNQEASSVSDMTASLMSLSSDFLETPNDENIPELEADPRKTRTNCDDRLTHDPPKSSIESILYDKCNTVYFQKNRGPGALHPSSARQEAATIKRKVLEEEFGLTGDGSGGRKDCELLDNISETTAWETNLNVSAGGPPEAAVNAQRVLWEEYGIRLPCAAHDANANLQAATILGSGCDEEDHNGNGNGLQVTPAEQGDINANPRPASLTTTQAQAVTDDNANLTQLTVCQGPVVEGQQEQTKVAQQEERAGQQGSSKTDEEDEENRQTAGNSRSTTEPSVQQQRKVREACNEERTTTSGPNTVSHPASTATAQAARNKEKVLEVEYAITGQQLTTPFVRQEDEAGPSESEDEGTTLAEDLLTHVPRTTSTARPYDTASLLLMGDEPLLDVTGTALMGRPRTREADRAWQEYEGEETATLDLASTPMYFLRSIRMHVDLQSRLVNASLLSEVLVQESLLDHLRVLRALLLLHDGHFARTLTTSLVSKAMSKRPPAAILVPFELNNTLSKAIAESCCSNNPKAENLSFVVKAVPPSFSHTTSVVECVELQYQVQWPHNLVLDPPSLHQYSQVWSLLAQLHHSLWATDNLFHHTAVLSRQDRVARLVSSPHLHRVCLFRHNMHHFLLLLQSYIIAQVHQISWTKFDKKLKEEVSCLDDLYHLHSSLLTTILSRCFLTAKGSVILKLLQQVFSLVLRFHQQVVSQPWQNGAGGLQHPAFPALTSTYQQFQHHAHFLHQLLVRVRERTSLDPSLRHLLACLTLGFPQP